MAHSSSILGRANSAVAECEAAITSLDSRLWRFWFLNLLIDILSFITSILAATSALSYLGDSRLLEYVVVELDICRIESVSDACIQRNKTIILSIIAALPGILLAIKRAFKLPDKLGTMRERRGEFVGFKTTFKNYIQIVPSNNDISDMLDDLFNLDYGQYLRFRDGD